MRVLTLVPGKDLRLGESKPRFELIGRSRGDAMTRRSRVRNTTLDFSKLRGCLAASPAGSRSVIASSGLGRSADDAVASATGGRSEDERD